MPTNSEDTNLLHKVNNLYRELGDKPEVQRLMTLNPTNQLYSKWGASVDPEEHPEMETLGFINRSLELPYSRAKRYIKQCVEKYGELPGLNTWPMYFVFQDDLNRRNYYYGYILVKLQDEVFFFSAADGLGTVFEFQERIHIFSYFAFVEDVQQSYDIFSKSWLK